ncbi:hypothetical protein TNCV_3262681 [Trichonephila clavipes]|nr:hypothetical protein TNCV_3262681 [Trichonephila clavipes]
MDTDADPSDTDYVTVAEIGPFHTVKVAILDATVMTESVDTAVQEVTNVLIVAADLSIPKVFKVIHSNVTNLCGILIVIWYKNRRKVDSAGRSTLDNLVFLESEIRDAFVRRNHLVSLFFDIESIRPNMALWDSP